VPVARTSRHDIGSSYQIPDIGINIGFKSGSISGSISGIPILACTEYRYLVQYRVQYRVKPDTCVNPISGIPISASANWVYLAPENRKLKLQLQREKESEGSAEQRINSTLVKKAEKPRAAPRKDGKNSTLSTCHVFSVS
jgi:hypothetical protein